MHNLVSLDWYFLRTRRAHQVMWTKRVRSEEERERGKKHHTYRHVYDRYYLYDTASLFFVFLFSSSSGLLLRDDVKLIENEEEKSVKPFSRKIIMYY